MIGRERIFLFPGTWRIGFEELVSIGGVGRKKDASAFGSAGVGAVRLVA